MRGLALLGAGAPVAGEQLRELYATPTSPARGRWLRANMIATLDGAAAGPDERTASIGTPADRTVFDLLRELSDVVLVGAGTARAEHYRPEPGVVLAVVTGRGSLPAALADDGGSVLAVTRRGAGPRALQRLCDQLGDDRVVVAGDDEVDLPAALDALADRGLRQVLCEGGPSLLADVVRAGELDELCLTTVPRLQAGDAPRLLTGPLLASGSAAELRRTHLLAADDGTLLACWTR